jgi:hypothetical protein
LSESESEHKTKVFAKDPAAAKERIPIAQPKSLKSREIDSPAE